MSQSVGVGLHYAWATYQFIDRFMPIIELHLSLSQCSVDLQTLSGRTCILDLPQRLDHRTPVKYMARICGPPSASITIGQTALLLRGPAERAAVRLNS